MYNFGAATYHFLCRYSYLYSAVFEQNIASARRPSFMRYHVISGGLKGGGPKNLDQKISEKPSFRGQILTTVCATENRFNMGML